VLGERHLRHLLRCYADYYNQSRTHLSLNKDAPVEASREGWSHPSKAYARRSSSSLRSLLISDKHSDP
jgi:hypothetical protein